MTAERKRVVLVTGSSQGIGLAIAEAFIQQGCRVLINGRDENKLKESKARLDEFGEVEAIVADVTVPEQVGMLGKQIGNRFDHLDVLVNNVGNFVFTPILQHSRAQWREVFDSNLTSTFLLSKTLIPLLELSEAGRIINIAASYASATKGFSKYGVFAAAKAALVSLTRSLSLELAPKGVTVNVVSPGLIDTGSYDAETIKRWSKVVPMQRFGRPEEVARAVLFFADPESSYITGAELIVSGGWEGEIAE